MIEKTEKSVIPIYSIGVTWLLWAVLLPMYSLLWLLLAGAVSVAVYFITSKIFPGEKILVPSEINIEKSGDSLADSIIEKGKSFIQELNSLNAEIESIDITKNISDITEASHNIFDFISKNPKNARQINTFIDYYYPTLIKLLNTYVELCAQDAKGDNIKTTLGKIEHTVEEVVPVFHKQLDNLFEDKALDISTDISVMKSILKSEGLGGAE